MLVSKPIDIELNLSRIDTIRIFFWDVEFRKARPDIDVPFQNLDQQQTYILRLTHTAGRGSFPLVQLFRKETTANKKAKPILVHIEGTSNKPFCFRDESSYWPKDKPKTSIVETYCIDSSLRLISEPKSGAVRAPNQERDLWRLLLGAFFTFDQVRLTPFQGEVDKANQLRKSLNIEGLANRKQEVRDN